MLFFKFNTLVSSTQSLGFGEPCPYGELLVLRSIGFGLGIWGRDRAEKVNTGAPPLSPNPRQHADSPKLCGRGLAKDSLTVHTPGSFPSSSLSSVYKSTQ